MLQNDERWDRNINKYIDVGVSQVFKDVPDPRYGDRFTARRKFMKGLCKTAKVKAMGFHALRRYFASKLVENGEDLETVRFLMGHKAVSTTDKYVYRLKSDLRMIKAAVNKFSEKKAHEKAHREEGKDGKSG